MKSVGRGVLDRAAGWGAGVHAGTTTLRAVGQNLFKFTTCIPYDLAFLFLTSNLEKHLRHTHTHTHE